ncbi:MAG: cysteine desulfurase [Oscillospiraceae bacterium]|nr:cysteine desulfurase [Oscillospiraceae bacterium]
MIYLDNAATTKVCLEAGEAALFAMREAFGNPSSLHGMGIEAEKLINFTKEQIASALSCSADEIIFTSGATESNNTAILGLAANYGKRKRRVVTTAVEHPSVAEPFEKLKAMGFEVCVINPDENGEMTADMIIDAVDDNTCLVSAMLVNNETGYILPIAKAFSEVKRYFPECYTHCDAVQGFEKLSIKAKALCADTISFSGHKIYAPKGVGGLYIKKGVRVAPLLVGGGQQKNLRSGTESVPLIYALGKTVEMLTPTITERYEKASDLKSHAIYKLGEIDGVIINSKDNYSPYILSVSLPGYKSETVLHFLEQSGIYVSSGSACSRGKKSSVLAAFGYGDKLLDSTLRISFSCENTHAHIDSLADGLFRARESLARIK